MKIKGPGWVSVGFCEEFGYRIGRGRSSEGGRSAPVASVWEQWLLDERDAPGFGRAGSVPAGCRGLAGTAVV
jgi:hypothetical protein